MTKFAGAGVVRALTAFPRSVGVTVLRQHDDGQPFTLGGDAKDLGRLEIVKVVGRPFARAIRAVTTTTPGAEPLLYLSAPTNAPVRAGDVLLLRFWLRCHESMTGEGFTTFRFEPADYDAADHNPTDPRPVEFRIGAAAEWREIDFPFRAPRDFAPGEARVCFRIGFDRQTVELAGIQLHNHGRDAKMDWLPKTVVTYAGRHPDARWRSEALRRIEQHRKSELRVRVIDAADNPVPGASVRMTLRRHAFRFGSAVTVEHLLGTSEDAQQYRQIVERHFNAAVFENDMKWAENYDAPRPGVNEALDWLLKRGIRVRGHNLIWPSWRWLPKQLRQYASDPEELRLRAHLRIVQAVTRYRGRLVHWDVVNEPYSEHDLMDVLGKEIMVEWFKLAKQADPACKMYLNDYGIFDGGPDNPHREHFVETIRWMLDKGAPIEGVGIQSHFGALPAPPMRLLAVLDQFARFGLPIESTELSLNMLDRQLQADYMRDYLTVLFSHPAVEGVMLWGFWEGRHWRPDAALFDRDWTPRPVANAWIDLAHNEWSTDVTVMTDGNGVAQGRGFCGEYDVIVSNGPDSTAATARLDRGGAEVVVTLPEAVKGG